MARTTLPVEVPDDRLLFTCSTGHHELAAKTVLRRCPGYWRGSPCQGTLKRVGKGSKPR